MCEYLNVPFIPRDNLQNYPTIKQGSSNNFVFLLQFILNQLGYNLVVDGIFGNNTSSAVKDFQIKNFLSADGVVGRNTWQYLLTLPPYPILRLNSRGNYVYFLQNLLDSNFIQVGEIDGIFGQKTQNAVKQFQQQNSLTVDGIVGVNTWS